jgi:hypothetical protein
MSKDEGPKNAIELLAVFYHRLAEEVRDEHGHQARKAFARVAVMVVGLVFGGPILGAALWSMPTPLAVFIGLAVAFRVGRWFVRRYR